MSLHRAGCLEQQYPVAMAYVPWQQWQTTYAPERGLVQGTIFPDLDLQFNYGRCGR
ncbi:MAG: spore coat associated protein CotJA [Enterocloster sp.]